MQRFYAYLLGGTAMVAAEKQGRKGGGSNQPVQTTVCSEVPAHAFDLILGRPTDTGVTVSVLCYNDAEGRIVYGTQAGKPAARIPVRKFAKGETAEIVLAGLQPETRYFYQLQFVFIHQLVGGADEQSRGGAEAVPYYEWGGKNAGGSDGFKQNRAGWPAPIHQLLIQNKVNIVFHGHDHFYAKQDMDGIVYQEVPQPGAPGNGMAPRSAAEDGYKNGVIMGSYGHLRVWKSGRSMAAVWRVRA